MKQILKTFFLVTISLFAITGVTAFAAAQKIEKRSFIISGTAEVAADTIKVGTNNGGVVTDIAVSIGQYVKAGSLVAKIDTGDEINPVQSIMSTSEGVVKSILVSKNGFIKPQSELVEIIDSKNLYIKADMTIVPEDLLKISVGMPVDITVANTQIKGTISTIFPEYDTATSHVTIYCKIEDGPIKSRLVPGMPARVSLFLNNPTWETFSPYLKDLHLL